MLAPRSGYGRDVARDRVDGALGALLGTFVGDALGMPFEGRPPAAVPDRIEMVDARLGRVGELGDAGPADAAAALGNSAVGDESVPTAIYAAVSQRRFEDAVSFAVRCGGDTDTIGAMAGAIAGARDGASAIPGRWLAALEDGPRGRSHVERLARALVC